MKNYWLLALVVILLCSLIFGGCAGTTPATTTAPAATTAPAPAQTAAPASVAEVIKLKYASPNFPMDPVEMVAQYFLDYIEKESKGKVKIERFDSAALGGIPEQLELIKSGSCDIGFMVPQWFPADLPLSAILGSQPFSKQQAIDNVYELFFNNPETAPIFAKECERNNLKFMNMISAGEVGVIATFPVASLNDMKGKKIGAMFDQPWFKEYGLEYINLALPEVYEGLSRGLIDAMEMVLTPMAMMKWYEVSKCYFREGFNFAGDPQVVNLQTWKKLPPDIQNIFQAAGKATSEYSLKMDNDVTEKTLQTFKDAGLAINTIPRDEQTKLYKSMFAAWEEQYMGFATRAGVSNDAQVVIKHWKATTMPQ